MKTYGKTFMIASALMLVAAACGAGTDPAVEPTEDESTTTSVAVTTTTIATTTTEEVHEDDEEQTHEDDSHEDGNHEEGDEATSDADVTVDVVMTEFEFEPSSFAVSAGQTVRFVVTNDGLIEHEFRASNQHRIQEHLASGHEDHGEEGGHHEEGGDMILLVQPGETGELIMAFPEDTTVYTEIACLLPGHYEAGMKAPISYTGE